MATTFKPFVLASVADSGDVASAVAAAKQKLQAGGFALVGEHSMDDGSHILAVTSDALKACAAKSDMGGFGAALRVGVTKTAEGAVQTSYTNPRWMAHIYRMGSSLEDVAAAMTTALGAQEEFGCKKGLDAKALSKYHYQIGMPYFSDVDKVGKFASYDEAVRTVEAGLKAGAGHTRLVYRVDVPGKEETVFGVAILDGDGCDKKVQANCDSGTLKHTAHFPYELLVSGAQAVAFDGKFRIAQSWPDTSMATFMKISFCPGGIAKSLKAVCDHARQ